jgi:glutamyl-tRNA reductase
MDRLKEFLCHRSGIDAQKMQDHLYIFTCRKAIEHLFRVAAGLDSMILGENEILGQVSEAYETACANGSSGVILNTLFQRAISVGKKVRTETAICCGAVSVGSAAVQMVTEVFGHVKDCNVLLIGAGEMGELVARHITGNSPSRVTVCNRSYDRAVRLADRIAAEPAPFENLTRHLVNADIVISCTASPDYIISTEQLKTIMDRRNGRHLFLIDIAVPRDVEPTAGKLENVRLYNIDHLQSVADEGLKQRQSAVSDAEEIIMEKVDAFLRWLNSHSVTPVIRSLHNKAAAIRDEELTKALSKLGELTGREEKIIRSMARSIISRLINTPIMQLKEHAGTDQGHLYTQVARVLLGLAEQEETEDEAGKDRHQRQRVGALAD